VDSEIRIPAGAGINAPVLARPRVAGRGTRCGDCPIADSCSGSTLAALGASATARRVKRGETLCHADSTYGALYVVRYGSFKSQVPAADGRQQIIAFPLPGDVIGLDAIANDHHHSDTVALQDSEVCAFADPERTAPREVQAKIAAHLRLLMSREIVEKQRCLAILGTMCSVERVCAFLLELSSRCLARHWSSSRFLLHMTRTDIASFLGLQPETVSRALSRMQRRGHLRIEGGRQITITNPEGMRAEFACGFESRRAPERMQASAATR